MHRLGHTLQVKKIRHDDQPWAMPAAHSQCTVHKGMGAHVLWASRPGGAASIRMVPTLCVWHCTNRRTLTTGQIELGSRAVAGLPQLAVSFAGPQLRPVSHGAPQLESIALMPAACMAHSDCGRCVLCCREFQALGTWVSLCKAGRRSTVHQLVAARRTVLRRSLATALTCSNAGHDGRALTEGEKWLAMLPIDLRMRAYI